MTERSIAHIDVRDMAPRLRHPTIFRTWAELPEEGQIELVNDHDPVPLYYQFAVEHAGHFRWDYLEQGPEVWRVRISKGAFEHPGFVPGKAPLPVTVSLQPPKSANPLPVVLDVRPIFASGGSPCGAIDEAVASVKPNQAFVLLVPFEPAPLYSKLGAQGFSHQKRQMDDGTWRIEFRRTGQAQVAATGPVSCACSGH